MLSSRELMERWEDMPIYGGGFRRIDDMHPLEWYIGYEEINQKTLLLIADNDPGNISSSKSIIASTGQRQDGRWAISLRLIKKDNEDVFINLCWDIIESSRDKIMGHATVEYIIERYKKWLRLMEYQRADLMEESRRKGLIGEMMFLQDKVSEGMSIEAALNAWIGPDGADQDFIFTDRWTEIKCTGISTETISISSLEQLDEELPGFICVYFIDKTTQENINGFTLMGKVNQLRDIFEENIRAREIFENKLFMYGYADKKEYHEQKYSCRGSNIYKVDIDFPRLTKSNVPAQIVSAKYNISLAAIEKWKIK